MPLMTRRDLLWSSVGSAIIYPFAGRSGMDLLASAGRQAADPVAQMRAQMGAQPIVSARLSDTLTLLTGPGGNVIVLNGTEGKLVVDSFVQPAFPAFKQALDKMGTAPIRHADRYPLAHRSHRQQRQFPRRRRCDPRARQHEEAHVGGARSARHAFPAVTGVGAPDADLPRRAQAADERRAGGGRTHPSGAHRHRHLRALQARQRRCTSATCSSTACIRSSMPAPAGTSTADCRGDACPQAGGQLRRRSCPATEPLATRRP